jgi:hypothetical protein
VVHEQELEDTGPRLDDVGGIGRDDHSLRARRGARGLQLRHFLDLDEADATGPVDPQPRVVAVVRDREPVLDGSLEDGLALLDRDWRPVDRQRDGVHRSLIISGSSWN